MNLYSLMGYAPCGIIVAGFMLDDGSSPQWTIFWTSSIYFLIVFQLIKIIFWGEFSSDKLQTPSTNYFHLTRTYPLQLLMAIAVGCGVLLGVETWGSNIQDLSIIVSFGALCGFIAVTFAYRVSVAFDTKVQAGIALPELMKSFAWYHYLIGFTIFLVSLYAGSWVSTWLSTEDTIDLKEAGSATLPTYIPAISTVSMNKSDGEVALTLTPTSSSETGPTEPAQGPPITEMDVVTMMLSDFSDWKTYTNKKFGISFSYPPELPLSQEALSIEHTLPRPVPYDVLDVIYENKPYRLEFIVNPSPKGHDASVYGESQMMIGVGTTTEISLFESWLGIRSSTTAQEYELMTRVPKDTHGNSLQFRFGCKVKTCDQEMMRSVFQEIISSYIYTR